MKNIHDFVIFCVDMPREVTIELEHVTAGHFYGLTLTDEWFSLVMIKIADCTVSIYLRENRSLYITYQIAGQDNQFSITADEIPQELLIEMEQVLPDFYHRLQQV